MDEFRSWLVSRRYAPRTVDAYAYAVRISHTDPVAAFKNASSRVVWSHLRGAYHALGQYMESIGKTAEGRRIWGALREIPGPRKGPRRVFPVPTPGEWVDIARSAWRVPGALGAASWLVLWTSMRISDVLLLTRTNLCEAHTLGQTTCHQKGPRGEDVRRWVPGSFARLAVARLAGQAGYEVLWELLSTSLLGAGEAVRKTIPHPYTPHTFRRAFITYAVSQHMPTATIQAITGHASLSALELYIQKSIAVSPVQAYDAQSRFTDFIMDLAAREAPRTPAGG